MKFLVFLIIAIISLTNGYTSSEGTKKKAKNIFKIAVQNIKPKVQFTNTTSTIKEEICQYVWKIKNSFVFENSAIKLVVESPTEKAYESLKNTSPRPKDSYFDDQLRTATYKNIFTLESVWIKANVTHLKEFMTRVAQVAEKDLIPWVVMDYLLVPVEFSSGEIVVYLTSWIDESYQPCRSINEYLTDISQKPTSSNPNYSITYNGNAFPYRLRDSSILNKLKF